jgi:hypothetical protein
MNTESSTPDLQPSVRLRIERLIVDESLVATGQNRRLQTVIETELTRLLRDHGLTGLTSVALYNLPTGEMHVAQRSPSTQVGRQIARTVYAALSPESASVAVQDRQRTMR